MTEATRSSLAVDLDELCLALAAEATEYRWFLDLETGAVLLLTNEYEPEENGGLTVVDIESDSTRFRRVPNGSSDQTLTDMRAFIATLDDRTCQESLLLALEAPRPDKRFRSVLGWVPGLSERWHAFRQRQIETRARAWLESLGVGSN